MDKTIKKESTFDTGEVNKFLTNYKNLTTNISSPITTGKDGLGSSVIAPPPAPTPDNTNFPGIISGASNYGKTIEKDITTKTETPYTSESSSLLKKIGDLVGVTSGKEQYNQEQLKLSGAKEAEKRVKELNAQLQQVSDESNIAQRTLESQSGGKDVTSAFLGRQQQEVQRQSAIKSLTLSSQLAYAKGDLELAQSNAQRAVDLKFKDTEDEITRMKEMLQLYSPFMSAEQKAVADQKAIELQTAQDDISYKKGLVTSLINDANAEKNFSLSSKAMALDPKSPTFSQDISKLQAQMTANPSTTGGSGVQVTGKYSNAINTILGSGTFTDAGAKRVVDAINAGQNPLPIVKNQAKNVMGQTMATQLTKTEIAKDAMTSIGTLLDQYYANGGKTNIFRGTWEDIINKFGAVDDPKLRSIASSINKTMQTYRNNISGTSFSVQEGKEISKLFPGIDKTPELNKAVLEGVLSQMDSEINTMYTGVLGDAWSELQPKQEQVSNTGAGQNNFVSVDDAYAEWQKSKGVIPTPPASATTTKKTPGEMLGLGTYQAPSLGSFNLTSFFK
jgi:hypothetical protein